MVNKQRSKLRVIFAGHAGLAKSRVMESLREYIKANNEGITVGFYRAEDGLDTLSFLEGTWSSQAGRWRDSIQEQVQMWKDDDPDYAFLSMHLTYFRFGNYFSPFSWRFPINSENGVDATEHTIMDFIINTFKPHYFVTLIDDVPYVQHRISQGDFDISLNDLMSWRNIEIMMADSMAALIPKELQKYARIGRFPYEFSPVVSIRHPPSMLFRLLAHPASLRIYASFPITVTRNLPERRAEIDRFRQRLHQHFTVFDPLTIDEGPLESVERMENSDQGQLSFAGPDSTFSKLRWPLSETLCEATDVCPLPERREIKEITRNQGGKSGEIASVLQTQIETRDFRLLDQADCVVLYRPMYPKQNGDKRDDFSGGTGKEWDRAKDMGKPRFIVHDPLDGDLKKAAFRRRMVGAHQILHKDLSGPDNQKKALEELVHMINKEHDKIVSQRIVAEIQD